MLTIRSKQRQVGTVLVGLAIGLLLFWLLWRYWDRMSLLFAQADWLKAWFSHWGVFGPLSFSLLNALQVVVAPLPGSAVGVTSGYLFGWPVGSLAAVSGMLLGGWLAMLISRKFGRSLVKEMVGSQRMARWDHLAREDRRWPWLIVFLGPFGDFVFYVAGLSRVPLWQLVLLALISRGPAVAASVGIGAGLQVRSPLYVALSVLPWLVVAITGTLVYEKHKNALQQQSKPLGKTKTF